MKNPYDRLFSNEHDDDDTDSDSSFPARKPIKPLTVNDSIINFSLNKQKEPGQSAAEMLRAELEAASPTNEYKGDEDDEDEEDSDSITAKPRRRGVARSIRAMLKRRRSLRLQTASSVAASATAISAASPELATATAATKETNMPTERAVSETEVEIFLHDKELLPEISDDKLSESPQSEANITDETFTDTLNSTTAKTPPPTPPPLNIAALPVMFTAAQAAANAAPAVAAASIVGAGAAGAVGSAATSNLNQAPSVIIDRRNSLAGPFVAFLAANYLSKRRDRKIRREAKKTNRELEATQTRLRQESQRTGRLEDSVATVKRQSSTAPGLTEVARSLPEVPQARPNAPVKVAEVLAATGKLSPPKSAEGTIQSEQLSRSSSKGDTQKQPEQPGLSAEFLMRNQPSRQEATEFIKESDFDRRYEVKDAPATGHGPVAQSVVSSKIRSRAIRQRSPIATAEQPIAPPSTIGHSSSMPGTDLYKQSIRTGILAGVAVVILGSITIIAL